MMNIYRIRYKLVFVFTLLIVSTLALVISFTYIGSIDIIKNQSVVLNERLVELGKTNLEASIEEVDKVFHTIYLNKDYDNYFKGYEFEDEFDFYSTSMNIKNLIFSLLNSRKDIFSIIYIDKHNYIVYSTRAEAGYERVYNQNDMPAWFTNAFNVLMKKSEDKLILPTHKHIPLAFKYTDNKEKVVSIARSIVNTSNKYGILGVMFINLNLSSLRKIAADIKPYNDSFTYILSSDGIIVYDSMEQYTGEMLDAELLKKFVYQKGNIRIKMNDTNYVAIFTTSSDSGWKVINFIPSEEYSADVLSITSKVIVICIFAVILSVAVVFFVSKLISNPIEKLSVVMNKIDIGNMDLYVDESGQDEVGMLSRSFKDLIAKLKTAIQKEYESGIRQKDAEMRALQAQINPHFLYNVLQTVSSIAVLNNIDEINIIVKSLGRMLRYSIETRNNFATVGQECEHVSCYLSIQKLRYGDKLEYYINIPFYLKEYSILKLILQPIVENSIIHGFENKEDKGIIYLTGYKEEDSIVFDIEDNGNGIAPDRLEELTCEFRNYSSGLYSNESTSIGLKNVFIRLRLLYGHDAHISIDSEENIGTNVKVRIPVKS